MGKVPPQGADEVLPNSLRAFIATDVMHSIATEARGEMYGDLIRLAALRLQSTFPIGEGYKWTKNMGNMKKICADGHFHIDKKLLGGVQYNQYTTPPGERGMIV